jgi:hypothetical protein
MEIMFGNKSDKPTPSGAEMMMRSLGMGPVLDMAIGLANDGTLAKIVTFADQADEILKTLRRIENALAVRDYEAASNRLPGSFVASAGAAGLEACPRCGLVQCAGGHVCLTNGLVPGMPDAGSSAGHDHGSGPANGGAAHAANDGDNSVAV